MSLLPLLLALLTAPAQLAPPPVVSGAVSGSFNVASSGAASYQVSLTVPPGTNAMQPQLSIAYTSAGTNGVVGTGFSLGGLKAITRAGRTVLEDGQKGGVNYDANDRFALSGGRLINIGGTAYRTEQESWQQIVANGTCGSGPCSWTVTQPNGTVEQFTGVPAAGTRFNNAPYSGSMREWVLGSVTDANGNSMTISWTATPPQLGGGTVSGSTGVVYPSSIAYTANSAGGLTARRSVQFFYTTRPDPVMINVGGAEALGTALLAHVQTFVTPASTPVLVTDYRLAYAQGATQRSRLTSLTQCDGKGTCYPPTTFAWSNGPSGLTASSFSLSTQNIDTNQGWQGDFNGDGLTDLLSGPNYVSCLATAGGGFTCGGSNNLETSGFTTVADFNGDGRADLFSGSGTEAYVYYSTAAGFNPSYTKFTNFPVYLAQPIYVADFNGDGMADLFSQTSVSLSTGNGFGSALGPFNLTLDAEQTWPGDFNGDGMADLLTSDGCDHGRLYLFNGTGFTTMSPNPSGLALCGDSTFVADFNGDALPDILSSGGGNASMSWNNGYGFSALQTVNGLNTDEGQSWPGDFNGDGRTDVYVQGNNSGTLYVSVAPASGGNYFRKIPTATGKNITIAGNTSFLGDFNADGIADFYNADPEVGSFYFSSTATTNQLPDLLTSIGTGIGGGTSITYKPLTDPSVYTPAGSGALGFEAALLTNQFSYTPMSTEQVGNYPVVLGRGASYVVSSYTLANVPATNNQAYSYTYGYRYAAALVNLMGRGWLGFATMTRLDPQLNARVTTVYDQAFPYSGKTLKRATCGDSTSASPCTPKDASYLAAVAQSYICTDSIANTACAVDNSAYSPSSTDVYEVLTQEVVRDDAQWGAKSTSTFTYDQYGNHLSELHTGTTAASTLVTCRSYLNDTTSWRIGFVVNEKFSSAAGCPQSWQSYTFAPSTDLSWETSSYDANSNVQAQLRWDSANNQFLGEQYGRDAFGNVLTTNTLRAVPGSQPVVVANTTQTTAYDTTFQSFAVTSTTPLANASASTSALVSTSLYDPRFGTQIGQITANGAVQTTCLDGFGRTVATQGPQAQSNGPTQKNCLAGITAFSVPASFGSAKVITIGTSGQTAANGAVVSESASRNAWGASSTWSVTKATLDGMGRSIISSTPSDTAGVSIVSQVAYLDSRHPAKVSTPYFSNATPQWTTYTYDPRGRKASRTMPFVSTSGTTSTTTWTHCSGSRVAVTLNPSQSVTCSVLTPPSYTSQMIATYDQFARGPRRLSQTQTENGNALTTFQRDALGRTITLLAPASLVDGTRVTTTAALDSLGRVSSQSVTNAFDIDYTWDEEGLLDHQTDALGQKLVFTYDGLQRALSRTAYDSSGNVATTATFTWDTPAGTQYTNVAGLQATATTTGANGNVIAAYAWGYDPYGRPTVSTATINGNTYTFNTSADPQGRPTTLTYPDAAVLQTAYTPAGNLGSLALTPSGGTSTTYVRASSFNASGRPGTMQYGNGVTDSRTYTPQQSMQTHLITEGDGDVSLSDAYAWDARGNPLDIWDCDYTGNAGQSACVGNTPSSSTNGTDTYAYTAGRLTSASGPAGSFTFAYDANGNMTTLNGATLTYGGYQLDNGTNGFAAQYDAAGNMTSRTPAGASDTWTQTFDPEGNLTALKLDGVLRRAFAYDDQGQRVSETVYESDGTTVQSLSWRVGPYLELTQSGGNTSQTRFIPGPSGPIAAIGASGTAYFHGDHVQSTVRMTNAAGAQSAAIDYAPYGAPKITSGDAHAGGPLFDARPYDEDTGLMDFQSRIYDPASGQFLSADSGLSGPATRPDTPQRYIFGWGAPASYADPTGHGPVLDVMAIEFILSSVDDVVEAAVVDDSAMDLSGGASSAAATGQQGAEQVSLPSISQWFPEQQPVMVTPVSQQELDEVYAMYGGKKNFEQVTSRVGWHVGDVRNDEAAAREAAGRADPREFYCVTCRKVLRGDRTYQHGSRLIIDYQRDHYALIHSDRRKLALYLGLRRYGNPIVFSRDDFIRLYHMDIRLLCPPCNMGHRFEPTGLELLSGAADYLTEVYQHPYFLP
jgi:RHS repeat-associated protein